MTFINTISILLISCAAVGFANIEPQKCCQNELNILVNKRCAQDSNGKSPSIVLGCEEKYILSPHEIDEDYFNVTENGTLFIPDMDSFLLRDE